MNQTWGISGPAFLGLYVLLLALASAVGPLLAGALDRRAAGRPDGRRALPDPSAEELAVLADGPARVVQASVARLVEAGVLRIDRDRTLHSTGIEPGGRLDDTVVGAVRTRPQRSGPLVSWLRHAPVVEEHVASARRRGLLHDPAALARARAVALAALGAVIALGIARIVAGASRGAPIGFLVVLVLIAAPIGLAFAMIPTTEHRPTPRGTATLTDARVEAARARVGSGAAVPAGMLGPLGVAGLVAVGGFAFFPDDEVAGLLAAPPGGGGGSGGVDGGGGDGGGGGGCGGGGCGGGCGGG